MIRSTVPRCSDTPDAVAGCASKAFAPGDPFDPFVFLGIEVGCRRNHYNQRSHLQERGRGLLKAWRKTIRQSLKEHSALLPSR